MKRFILILFLLLAAREIRAFGLAGHAAIACIAEHHLTPRARANIMRYTDHRSIVYYASWMDEWRRSKGYEFTTHWHAGTVDAEFRSTPAVREASGAKGDCVVAVEQSIALLSEYDKLDDSTVLVHIKYLVHLLGDMHCPTHVYYYPDNMTLGKFRSSCMASRPTTTRSGMDSCSTAAISSGDSRITVMRWTTTPTRRSPV